MDDGDWGFNRLVDVALVVLWVLMLVMLVVVVLAR